MAYLYIIRPMLCAHNISIRSNLGEDAFYNYVPIYSIQRIIFKFDDFIYLKLNFSSTLLAINFYY